MFEEYGAPNTQGNESAIVKQWQGTVLGSDIAYDSFWQFGTDLPSGVNESDVYSLYYGTTIYEELVVEHARDMAGKEVGG